MFESKQLLTDHIYKHNSRQTGVLRWFHFSNLAKCCTQMGARQPQSSPVKLLGELPRPDFHSSSRMGLGSVPKVLVG